MLKVGVPNAIYLLLPLAFALSCPAAADPAETTKPAAAAPAAAATATPAPSLAPSPGTPAASPDTSAATTAPQAGSQPAATPSTAAAPAPAPNADAAVAAVRTKLADTAFAAKYHADDIAAAAAFYSERSGGALWAGKDGFNAKATALVAEIAKAPDWGLETKHFDVPAAPAAGAAADAQADAEAKLTLAAMTYVRHARGGRVNPRALSRILDVDPQIKDPKTVIADLAQSDAPDAVLRGSHPKHEQFERLRLALLKARGPVEPDAPVDPALKVKLPAGKSIKAGSEHADIALLRQRLKVPAEAGEKETLLDPKLSEALKAFQFQKGIAASGNLTGATRTALNQEGEATKKQTPEQNVQRLLINMEKWRWFPENAGSTYVWSNVPEFYARVINDGKEIFKEKIIAGQPEWATPTFSAEMQFVIFNPSWGVPDGIKQRELMPRLKKAGGGGFFDQLFGGSGGGSGVLKAYGLTAYKNGKAVDPDSIDWSSTDIRNYSFTQPPGAKNPLGIVKFRFPNKHDVYMHDTTQRELFAQSYRALSHGCMRVQNPMKFAEILLNEDKGWSPEQVSQARGSSGDITLDKHIPVHVTYFTAIADDNGKVSYFSDLYGHDNRISSALGGKPMNFDVPREKDDTIETAAADPVVDDGTTDPAGDSGKKKGKEKNKKKREQSSNDLISGSLSGLVAN